MAFNNAQAEEVYAINIAGRLTVTTIILALDLSDGGVFLSISWLVMPNRQGCSFDTVS